MAERMPAITSDPAEVAVPRATLGEGPCWDARTGTLYWTDIPGHRVHGLAADGAHITWEIGRPAGCIVPRAAGGLVIAAGDSFLALDPGTGGLTTLARVEPVIVGTRMNDGGCDAAGRFLAGTMAEDESPGAGALYRLDTDRRVTTLLAGVGISNGLGWSPDGRRMYYIDSLTHRVDAFDYGPVTGAIGNRRPLAHIGEGETVPDGLAVDSEGGVWVAVWGGGRVVRYAPDGRVTAVIRLPADNVTCCAFGGPDLRTLYITTADGPGSSAGALFTCRSAVAGLPTGVFRG